MDRLIKGLTSSAPSFLFFFFFFFFTAIIFCPQTLCSDDLEVGFEGQNNVGTNKNEKPSIMAMLLDSFSLLSRSHHVSTWDKLKSFLNQLQLQVSPPNLDFRSRNGAASRSGGEGDAAAAERVREAAAESAKSAAAAVEESAKSAAKVVGDAVQKTAEKVKETVSSNRESDDAELR